MKYSNFIKEYLNTKTGYVFLFLFSFVFSVFMVYFSFDARGTSASFGGMTGQLSIPYDVYYYSNYPVSDIQEEIQKINTRKEYTILGNVFVVPSGYVFDSWNTERDGTGIRYVSDDKIYSEEDISLYAQWAVSSVLEDEKVPSDDENESDDVIDTENNENITPDIGDDDTDNDDKTSGDNEDIENIVPDNSDNELDDNIEDDSSNNEDNSLESDSNGNSSSTSGNGTTGSGSNSNSSNTSDSNNTIPNVPSSSQSNNSNNNVNKEDKNEVNDTNVLPIVETYSFKFVSEGTEYQNTSCDKLDDGTCELVLPVENPNKEGFIFKGWSANSMCLSNSIINESISVTRGGIYYACFDSIIKETTMNFSFIVISIWIIAFVSIYLIIKRFRKKEIID